MRTLRLKNLSEYLISKGHVAEYKALNSLQKKAVINADYYQENANKPTQTNTTNTAKSIQMPWDTWNKLPEASRNEVKDFLNDFSWLPVVGIGSDSTTFFLSLFEKDYENAAHSLLMIALDCLIEERVAAKATGMAKTSGKTVEQFVSMIKTNKAIQDEIIGFGINVIDSQLAGIATALSKYTSDMMVRLSQSFNNARNSARQTIDKTLRQWIFNLQPGMLKV